MKTPFHLAAVFLSLSAIHQCAAATDKPSDLIVGKWRDHAEPQDAVMEFLKDGTGTITETTPQKTAQAKISWKVTHTYGNACVVVVKYAMPKSKEAKPLPASAKPLTWLVVFDGKDAFLVQAKQNEVTVMDRQK
jgi:hypothetical protein